METKTVKRGFGPTAGQVTAVKFEGRIYLFGINPTDHSRDVRPVKEVTPEMLESATPVTEFSHGRQGPVEDIWTHDQASNALVNWVEAN